MTHLPSPQDVILSAAALDQCPILLALISIALHTAELSYKKNVFQTLLIPVPQLAMCVPYIYRVPDPQHTPKPPLSIRSTKIQPPNVTFSAEFSPRLIYRTPSNSQRASNPTRGRPSAPHPTPETQFTEGFPPSEQLGEKELWSFDEEERRAEEGRAGMPQQVPVPAPASPPQGSGITPPGPAKGGPRVPLPQQAPPPRPPSPPIPIPLQPERLETRSPYSYVRRPPSYRARQRSRSSSASLISRRSFEALSRKVNTMLDRLTRLERWREERDADKSARRVRWELGPGYSRGRQEGIERSRGRDLGVERERLRERERWGWEGGGLGRR